VTIKAEISNVNYFEGFEEFFNSLSEGKDDVENIFSTFIRLQQLQYDGTPFRFLEYLSSIQSFTIKKNKKSISFKAEFTCGSGVEEFCCDMFSIFKASKARAISIRAVDNDQSEEINWERFSEEMPNKQISSITSFYSYKKPDYHLVYCLPIEHKSSGEFNLRKHGQLFGRFKFLNAHLHGEQIIFNPEDESKKLCVLNYKKGALHGMVTFYNGDETRKVSESFYVNGFIEGEAFAWDETGYAYIKTNFKSSEFDGIQIIQHDPNKKPDFQAEYKNGELHGSLFWNGELHGTLFSKRKERELEANFINGKPIENLSDKDLGNISYNESLLRPHRSNKRLANPTDLYLVLQNIYEQEGGEFELLE